jgi:hypothetical protein
MSASGLGLGASVLLLSLGGIFAAQSRGADGILLLYAGALVFLLCGWSLLLESCVKQGNPGNFSESQTGLAAVGLLALAAVTAAVGFSCGLGMGAEDECVEITVVMVTLAVYLFVAACVCVTAQLRPTLRENWHRPCGGLLLGVAVTVAVEMFVVGEHGQVGQAIVVGASAAGGLVALGTSIEILHPICGKDFDGFAENLASWAAASGQKLVAMKDAPGFRQIMFALSSTAVITGIVLIILGDSGSCEVPEVPEELDSSNPLNSSVSAPVNATDAAAEDPCTPTGITMTCVGIGLLMGGYWFGYVSVKWDDIKVQGAATDTTMLQSCLRASTLLGIALAVTGAIFLPIGVSCLQASIGSDQEQCRISTGPIMSTAGVACLSSGVGFLFVAKFQDDMASFRLRMTELQGQGGWKKYLLICIAGIGVTVVGLIIVFGDSNQGPGAILTPAGVMVAAAGFLGFCREYFDAPRLEAKGLAAQLKKSPTLLGLSLLGTSLMFMYVAAVCVRDADCAETGMYASIAAIGSSLTTVVTGLILVASVTCREYLGPILQQTTKAGEKLSFRVSAVLVLLGMVFSVFGVCWAAVPCDIIVIEAPTALLNSTANASSVAEAAETAAPDDVLDDTCGDSGKLMTAFAISALFLGFGPGLMIVYWEKIQSLEIAQIRKEPPMVFGGLSLVVGAGLLVPGLFTGFVVLLVPGSTALGVGLLLVVANTPGAIEKLREVQQKGLLGDNLGYGIGMCALGTLLVIFGAYVASTRAVSASMAFVGITVLLTGATTISSELLPVERKSTNKVTMQSAKKKLSFLSGGVFFVGGMIGAVVGISSGSVAVVNLSMCSMFGGIYFLLCSFFWQELGNAGMEDADGNQFMARAKLLPLPVGAVMFVVGVVMVITGAAVTGSEFRANITYGTGWMAMAWGFALMFTVAIRQELQGAQSKLQTSIKEWKFDFGAILMLAGMVLFAIGIMSNATAQPDDDTVPTGSLADDDATPQPPGTLMVNLGVALFLFGSTVAFFVFDKHEITNIDRKTLPHENLQLATMRYSILLLLGGPVLLITGLIVTNNMYFWSGFNCLLAGAVLLIGTVFHERYTLGIDTISKQGTHPVFIVGTLAFVAGVSLIGVGWACMEGNQIGGGDCWLMGHRLVPWGTWLVGFGYYMVFMKLEWRTMSDMKDQFPNGLFKLHPTYTAVTFVVAAIVVGSVAAALMDDTLVGVDCSPGAPCYGPPGGPRNTGWLLMKMAFAMMGNGVVILGTMALRMKMGEDFNISDWLQKKRLFLERWFFKYDAVAIFGNVLTVLSVIGFLIGLICIGRDTCATTGVWFTMLSVNAFCFGILLRLWKYANEYADAEEGATLLKRFKEGGLCVGVAIFVTGIHTLSGGLACLDGTIGGATECRPAGILFTILGSCVVLLGLLVIGGATYWSKMVIEEKTRKADKFKTAMGPLMHLFKPTKGRIFALIIDIAGIVIFSFGAACLNSTLVGVEDCQATGVVLIILGPSLLFCGVSSAYLLHYWAQALSFSSLLRNVAKKPLWVVGEVLFVIGIVLVSVGWACANNNLGKIEECNHRKAIVTLIFGAPIFTIGFVCMIISFIYENVLNPNTKQTWDKGFAFLKAIVRPHGTAPATIVGLLLMIPGIVLLIGGMFCFTTPDVELDGVVLPNCRKAGKIMLIIGLCLLPLGLIINISTAWWKVLASEKRQSNGRRCGRRFQRSIGIGENTKSTNAVLSFAFITIGSVLLAVGWAGLVGTLAGQRLGLPRGYILPHNGLMLVLLGGGSLLFALGMLVAQFIYTGEDEKADLALLTTFYPRLWKNSTWFFGLYLFVISTKMCSTSFACFADSLAGVSSTVEIWPRVDEVKFGDPTYSILVPPSDWNETITWGGPYENIANPEYYDRLAENCRAHAYCVVVPGDGLNVTCIDDPDVPPRQRYMAEEVVEQKHCSTISGGEWMHPTEPNECPKSFAIVLISVFAPLWFAGIALIMQGIYSSLGVAAKDKVRTLARRTLSKPSFRVGMFCLASGIILGSVGGACANNTLVGVDDCMAQGWVLLYIGFVTGFTGMAGQWITKYYYYDYEDYDDVKKADTDKQMQMLCVMQLAVPFFTWGVSCTARGPFYYYTCGPTGIWGGLFLMMMPAWTLGLGVGMYVHWNKICGGCVHGLDTIIADPRSAPVVVLRAVKAKEKEWKNYRAQNPNVAENVDVANECCSDCCQSFTNFVLGCVDNRYFCARWILANYIPPPEEDDAAEAAGGLAPDDISVSGFGDDSDEEGGSFSALVKGRKLKLVPDWNDSPPRRKCCCMVTARQHPAEERHFWMTERPLELRWAERRGTFFTRARVKGCREDVKRWADEIAAMRALAEQIETKPFGPKKPDPEEELSALEKLKLDAATPTQADINEEERLRRQQLDVIAEKIDVLEEYQARSFTVHTEQKGDVQIMVPLETSDGRQQTQSEAEAVRDMWVEKLQDMIAEYEAAVELLNAEGEAGDADDDDDDGEDDDGSASLEGPLADWLQENSLSSAADVLEDYIKPLTLEEVKKLTRKQVQALGMDEELNDNEMAALETALEWQPEVKRKKPGDYPKGKVVLKVQIRGGATGSGLMYSFKEQRVTHSKLEPSDSGDIELLETIAEHINSDESMNERYLPMTADKIALAIDYGLDDGSTGKPAGVYTDGVWVPAAQSAVTPLAAQATAAAAVARAEVAHQAVVDEYNEVQAVVAAAEEEEGDTGVDAEQLERLEELMQKQDAAKQKLDQAAAWHSAEKEHAALVAEREEVQALVSAEGDAAADDTPGEDGKSVHAARLEAIMQAEKEAEEHLQDVKATHGEENGDQADDEPAGGPPSGGSEDETSAVGDSWTLTVTLPGDVDDWDKSNGHGENACGSVEQAVAATLDLAGDADIDGFRTEVLKVMEFTPKLKKKLDKSKKKALERRKAARKEFYGNEEDPEAEAAEEGDALKKHDEGKGGGGRWSRKKKKKKEEASTEDETAGADKENVDGQTSISSPKTKKKRSLGRFSFRKGAEDEATSPEGEPEPEPEPEPEIEGEGETRGGDGTDGDEDESIVPPPQAGEVGVAGEPPAAVADAAEAEEEEIDWSVNNAKTRKAKAKKEKEEKNARKAAEKARKAEEKEAEKARKAEEKAKKAEEKNRAKEEARRKKADEKLEKEKEKAIAKSRKAKAKAEKAAAAAAAAAGKADDDDDAVPAPEPEPEPEPELEPGVDDGEQSSLADRIAANAAEQQADFDAETSAGAAQ